MENERVQLGDVINTKALNKTFTNEEGFNLVFMENGIMLSKDNELEFTFFDYIETSK